MQLNPNPDPAGAIPDAAAETWTAYAGGIGCPDGHPVGVDQAFCSGCGRAVPGHIAARARALTEQLNNGAGIDAIRNGF